MTIAEMKAQIRDIDRQITSIYQTMRHIASTDESSAESWQSAWDKHPDLHQQERQLYRERAHMQAQILVAEYEASKPKRRAA